MSSEKCEEATAAKPEIIQATNQRWAIIALYIVYSGINSYQWIEYSIVTNIITKYYQVDTVAVNWTSVIYMALYAPLVIPASYIIDKKGCRMAALIGCTGTLIGTAVKVFSIGQNLFYVVMIGQAIVSASQSVILCLPPKLASVWFKANEVSTACSLGIFGTMLGCAMGYVLSPIMVRDHDNLEDIGNDLRYLCWILAIAMTPPFLAVIFYFPSHPKFPPNKTQLNQLENPKEVHISSFFRSVRKLLTNKGFLIHGVAYGINIAVFSAVGSILNEIILPYFTDAVIAGNMGLVMVVVGMVGAVMFGILLDRTHKYKEITIFVYFMAALSVVGLMYALESRSKVKVFIALGLFGFFTNAYMPAGFELAVELTYPCDESTVSGLIVAASQILGVLFTIAFAKANILWGTFWALGSQAVLLLLGTIVTAFIPNVLRRQEAFKEGVQFTLVPNKEII